MRLTGRTRLAGIMGWPIGHSRSPALHNFWLEEQGIDGVYVPLAVRPEHYSEREARACEATLRALAAEALAAGGRIYLASFGAPARSPLKATVDPDNLCNT